MLDYAVKPKVKLL